MELTQADLVRAIAMAARAHAGQARKFSGEPYIVHPFAVMERIKAAGGDIAQQIAGMLHDVVEDTDVTLEEVEAAFGPDVAFLVEAVTKRSKEEETYFEFIARSIAAGPRVQLVKRADVEDNVSDLPAGEGLHKRYAKTLALLDAAEAS